MWIMKMLTLRGRTKWKGAQMLHYFYCNIFSNCLIQQTTSAVQIVFLKRMDFEVIYFQSPMSQTSHKFLLIGPKQILKDTSTSLNGVWVYGYCGKLFSFKFIELITTFTLLILIKKNCIDKYLF